MDFFRRNDRPEPAQAQQMTDEQALARYRYMLSTAPPDQVERAHEEAFARLTPEQRRQALQALAQYVPPEEIRGDDPASLARTATRAEVRQPGTIERAWGGGGMGGGAGFGLGSFFLTTLAASFIGTAIAQSFFDSAPVDAASDGSAEGAEGEATADGGMGGEGGDAGGGDFGGFGSGGDFGGGDFGGGDFGGGDF
jgi:hypothetical protein